MVTVECFFFLNWFHKSLYEMKNHVRYQIYHSSCRKKAGIIIITFFSSFLAFDFCRFCMVIQFFHPRHNGQWPQTSKDFYTRSYPLYYFLILILEKEPVFPFSMLSAKQGNLTGTIFITSLVWRGPWLGIEPGTSRTRCQHSTTRLSKRW